jgi:hypothetical protein
MIQEIKVDSSLHKISSSDSDSSNKNVVISKKRTAKPSSPAPKKLKLSSVESSEDLDHSTNLVAENLLDDSFNNLLPVSNMKLGRYVIKNYENKDKSLSISPPTHAIKSTNKDCVVTTLNGKISFISLGEKARQKHDVKSFGIKPCALHPICSNMLYGGEDIAYVYVCDPNPHFHKNYEKRVWVCFYHGKASFEGHEVQTQHAFEVINTPKNKQQETTDVDAPVKAPAPAPVDVEPEEKPLKEKSAKAKLEDSLNSTSSEDLQSSEEDSPVKHYNSKNKRGKEKNKSNTEEENDETESGDDK